MERKNGSHRLDDDLSAAQTNAMIILLGEILIQVSKDREAAQVAREKSAAVLVRGGLSMEKAAKLLSLQKKKVVAASKKISI